MADIKTPVGDAPVIPLVLLMAGLYIAWFGIHYWRSDIKYPSTPVKDILQGNGLTPSTPVTAHKTELLADVTGASAQTGASGPATGTVPNTPPVGSFGGGGTPDANKNMAKLLASTYGWSSGAEWDALVNLWERESGWSNTADTRVTHAGGDNMNSSVFAYGIAQARPATKYPLPGQPPDKGGKADAGTQITWGLIYIQQSYGSPTKAWAHEQANGWY